MDGVVEIFLGIAGVFTIICLAGEVGNLRRRLASAETMYAQLQVWMTQRQNETAKKAARSDAQERERMQLVIQGPFRELPEADIEFADPAGQMVGASMARFEVKVNKHGILVTGTSVLTASRDVALAAYSVWFGDNIMHGVIDPPRKLRTGDHYQQVFTIPVELRGGFHYFGDPEPAPVPQVPVAPDEGRVV